MSGAQTTSILAQILVEFDRERRPLSSRELASTFGKDIAVVEGMLETLVRSGRLVELGRDGPCDKCPAQGLCIVLPLEGRRFCLVPHEGWELPSQNGTCWEARDRDKY
jgi:predicted transcriptional regulator